MIKRLPIGSLLQSVYLEIQIEINILFVFLRRSLIYLGIQTADDKAGFQVEQAGSQI